MRAGQCPGRAKSARVRGAGRVRAARCKRACRQRKRAAEEEDKAKAQAQARAHAKAQVKAQVKADGGGWRRMASDGGGGDGWRRMAGDGGGGGDAYASSFGNLERSWPSIHWRNLVQSGKSPTGKWWARCTFRKCSSRLPSSLVCAFSLPHIAGISFLRWPMMWACAFESRTRLTSSFTLRTAAFLGTFFRSLSKSAISFCSNSRDHSPQLSGWSQKEPMYTRTHSGVLITCAHTPSVAHIPMRRAQ